MQHNVISISVTFLNGARRYATWRFFFWIWVLIDWEKIYSHGKVTKGSLGFKPVHDCQTIVSLKTSKQIIYGFGFLFNIIVIAHLINSILFFLFPFLFCMRPTGRNAANLNKIYSDHQIEQQYFEKTSSETVFKRDRAPHTYRISELCFACECFQFSKDHHNVWVTFCHAV